MSVDATGFCDDGVWRRTVPGDRLDSAAVDAVRIDEHWRQCSSCADAWSDETESDLATCPACGALTRLTDSR
jgi:predicted anti-sigma-YlaC factor YlaD